MQSTVGAYDAKTHLATLLDQVEAGASVVITRRGRPVARLVPVGPRRQDVGETIAAIHSLGRDVGPGAALEAATIRDMIEEGRR